MRKFVYMKKVIFVSVIFNLLYITTLTSCNSGTSTQESVIHRSINVLSYNVKGDTREAQAGGWNNSDNHDTEIGLIKNSMESLDFISLQQSVSGESSEPLPLVFENNKTWKVINSSCSFDGTQIAYDSSKWILVNRLSEYSKSFGGNNGFGTCLKIKSLFDGRPYNMGLFKNVQNHKEEILFISVHFPHGQVTEDWNLEKFIDDAKKISGSSDLKNIHMIMAGDMNEIGDENYFFDFENIFGHITPSSNLITCCRDDGFHFAGDKVVTNLPASNSSQILSGWNVSLLNVYEEHKPIKALIEWN